MILTKISFCREIHTTNRTILMRTAQQPVVHPQCPCHATTSVWLRDLFIAPNKTPRPLSPISNRFPLPLALGSHPAVSRVYGFASSGHLTLCDGACTQREAHTLWQVQGLLSFLWPNKIPSYGLTTISFSTHQLMNIWAASTFCLL